MNTFVNFIKPFRVFAFLTGIFFLLAPSTFAQDVRIEAEMSSRKVALGSTVQLTITIHGDNNVAPVQLPEIEGFDVQYVGPSTRVSIINGQHSTSKTFMYSLFPLREGRFKIPSMNVEVSGKIYTVEPITVEVVGSLDQSKPVPENQPVSLKDKIFVTLQIPKQEVYLNERLPVKVLLFISGLNARDIQYPQMDNVGFSIDDYEKPQQYNQVANGTRYNVVEFNTVIYPTRTGELDLGPAKVEANILVQSSGRSSSLDRQGGLFDDDFFNSFFDRHEKRSIALESEKVTINALPLPQEGKPNNFSGAVGQFDFNVSVSPTDVKEGDPITLRMTILGKGSSAAIQVPSLPSGANFKLYDPQVFEKNNIKKVEQVIIPQSDQIEEVPAISFSYFDPQLKKYRTIARGPFPITVTKLEKDEEFKVVGLEGEVRPVAPETLGQDIVFIKNRPGRLRIAGKHVYNGVLFYMVILLAAALWLAAWMHYERTHRMRTDIVYARRLQAPRKAKHGLAQAKKLIAAGKKEEFYDTIFKTIQQYLGNKLHLSSGAVTFETVQIRLSSKNIEQKVIDDIKLSFEECDMIRYAAADINQENMETSYRSLAQIIDYLERSLR